VDGGMSDLRAAVQAQAHRNQMLKARAAELMGELERLRSGLDELRRNLLSISVTVTSDDGMVTVTVGPRGQVQRLDLDPRIYRRPDARALADTILTTIQRAVAQAQERVEAVCKPYVPPEEVREHLNFDFTASMRRLDQQFGGLGLHERS
jgi:DNA-binding protein YbaB